MNQVYFSNYRIQIINKHILRLEYSHTKSFSDDFSFFITNRPFEKAIYRVEENDESILIYINDYKIYVSKESTNFKQIVGYYKGEIAFKSTTLKNSGELPFPNETPYIFPLVDNPKLLIPKNGYTADNEINDVYSIVDSSKDLYLLLTDGDFRLLRKLYISLTGKCELPRLVNLGVWNSRYFEYDENSAKEMIIEYKKYGIPLDNMVIDTDWRQSSDRGIGYEINRKLFPHMKDFFEFAHDHDVEIMFNDHPEPIQGAKNCLSKTEIEYRERKLTNLLELGLDTWWYDRNWHTKLISINEKIYPETLGLYLFNDVTKNYFNKNKKGNYARRSVIMGNVVDIKNGDYVGIIDSASHRYPIQWTGDIASEEDQILIEIETLIKGENSLISYINSDIGGHTGNPDKETYIKWIQFGALSPIFRPHCTKNVLKYREPWNYDNETIEIFKDYVRLRYHLLPYIYSACFRNYTGGEPIFKAMSYLHPFDKKSINTKNQYFIGDNILISSNALKSRNRVKSEYFCELLDVTFFNGRELKGQPILHKKCSNIYFSLPKKYFDKSIPLTNFSMRVKAKVCFPFDTELYCASDDGIRVYVNDELKVDSWFDRGKMSDLIIHCDKNEIYELEIEYYQGLNEAHFELLYLNANKNVKNKIYIPEGEFYSLFDGKIINGPSNITKKYKLNETGLFVKLGSCIPLAFDSCNLKNKDWSKLIYDVYPSKKQCDKGFVYEDDGETVAYKSGIYNISKYETYFNEKDQCFVLKLYKTKRNFNNKINFRNTFIKMHLINDFKNIRIVKINGIKTKFNIYKKDEKLMPFEIQNNSRDSKTLVVKLKQDIKQDYEICFHLGGE